MELRPRVRKTTKDWIATAIALTIIQLVATAILPRGIVLSAVSDSVWSLLFLALVIAFARNAVPTYGRLRVFWIMQTTGWSITLINQLWWMYYDIILQKPVPAIFAGDVLLYLPGILLLSGFLLRPHVEQSSRNARLGAVDFLLLVVWWVFFYVYLVSSWQYVSPDEALYNSNYDRLYLFEILIVASVLVNLIRKSEGTWRRFYALYLCAIAFNYLWFSLENRAIENYTYFVGSWYDPPYILSLAAYMILAMFGRNLRLTRDPAQVQRIASWSPLAIIAVLSLPIMVVVAVLENGLSLEIMHFRVIVTAIAISAMASLVFMKQQLLHRELKRANVVLEESSTTDPLTGIRNRRFFSDTIQRDVAQTIRGHLEDGDRSERDLIFYLVDLDNFKKINDLYGHDGGDRVLIESARRITSAIRNADLLVRWGGEEFLVVSRSSDRRQAGILAQRILDVFRARPIALDGGALVHQTCSIGWAAFPWLEDDIDAVNYERVLKYADRALYRAKKSGKDQAIASIPSGEGAITVADTKSLASAIESMLAERDEFEVTN
jgi:diguanylate cyclase (GGDEF)-like protein